MQSSETAPSAAAARRRQQRRVPNDKRKRAANACAQCKARKSKCIRSELGGCQRCRMSALPCEYSGNDMRVREGGKATFGSSSVNQRSGLSTARDAYSTPAGSHLANACQSERFMWPGFLAKLRESFSLDPDPSVQPRFSQHAPVESPLASDLRSAELQRLRQATHAFPPREQADNLLTILIEHGTDSFFYFDQAEFLAGINEFYENPSSELRIDTGFVCLAHAAFALGSQWVELASSESSVVSSHGNDRESGREFYEQARSLIPDLDDKMSLESVQAPFVLGVYSLPARATGSLHMYLGLALRKALALDLHVATDDAQLSLRAREVRSRLWWAVFSLERTLTLKLNRPRSVDPQIITVPLPQPMQALDSSQSFDNSPHQAANARLTLILDKLADTSKWNGDEDIAVHARASLKTWKQSLPPNLRLENVISSSASYRATFHLHLNYYFAWIAMGKYKVVSAVRSRLRSAFGPGAGSSEAEGDSELMSKPCVKAAQKMLELFGKIRNVGKLTKSSFTDFQGCSIATMVLLVAGILERDLCYETRISFGLDCLRSMAGDNAAATTGVDFMEALKSIADEAAEKLRRSNTVVHRPTNGETPPTTSSSAAPDLSAFVPPPATADPEDWSLAEDLQPSPGRMLDHATWNELNTDAWAMSADMNDEPFSFLQHDNEAFLMELTGLDVLGISGS